MIFNALAGILISVVGAISLYAIDAVTFGLAALCYVFVKVQSDDDESDDPLSYLEDVREGLQYLSNSTLLLIVIVSSVALNTMFGAILAVLPEFADLHGSSVMFGVLMAAIGIGTILGSFFASSIRNWSFGTVSIIGFPVAGTSLIVSTFAPGKITLVALFTLALIPVGVFNVFIMTTTQTIVPNDLLGRVTATLGSTTGLAIPVGSLVGGYFADVVGTPSVIAIAGGGLICTGIYWALVPTLREFPSLTELERDSQTEEA